MSQDIQYTTTNYYHILYSKDEIVGINTQARRICLSSVPKITTEKQNTLLIQPFRVDDLYNALKDLPLCKILSLDDILTNFLKELWEDIKDDFVTLMQF